MAEVEAFKTVVLKARDVLRRCAITEMNSMRHICLYILSRYITRERAASLGIPDKFCWENLIDLIDHREGGVQFAFDLFNNPHADERLIDYFDRIFGTQEFSFSVKDIDAHKEILELFRNINLDKLDESIDVLGWIYEQHLATGSQNSRDLGQFFTDRALCKYMIGLCEPGFKASGVPETICDPTMGTGGFLTTYIKYYREHWPDVSIDWRVQAKEIYGCDNDAKVAGVARINLFMATHGARVSCDNVATRDSLYSDVQRTGFDIIAANMPFGIKNLVHAKCCERVKKIGIQGTKSEPLFLHLMMASLNLGGRCAVVVPDSILTSNVELHCKTRKYLLDNFDLCKVIKTRGKLFMNTGIQPSILFFRNEGMSSGEIDFCELTKNDDGTIIEETIATVDRDELNHNLSLDVRRYVQSEQELRDEEVAVGNMPTARLGDVLIVKSGKANTNRSDSFTIPYYDSNGPIGFVEAPQYTGEYVITAIDLSIGAVHYINGSFSTSNHAVSITSRDSSRLMTKFFYYWLLHNNWILKRMAIGVKPGIRKTEVENIIIPVPPIEIQREIVHALDNIQVAVQNAKQIIACSPKNARRILNSYLSGNCVSCNDTSLTPCQVMPNDGTSSSGIMHGDTNDESESDDGSISK